MELCRRLRSSGNTTPVLMLTARDDVDERVQALDAGVDDYLTKPFNLKELHARVRARLRRGGYEQEARGEASGIALGDLLLDPIERRVQRGERSIALSQREFELLLFLVRNADEVQSRQTILDAVWGAPFVGDPNTLDVYMGYLRKKVEAPGRTATAAHRARRGLHGAGGGSEILKRNCRSAPPPGASPINSSPCIASISSLTVARPMPLPRVPIDSAAADKPLKHLSPFLLWDAGALIPHMQHHAVV